MSQINLKSITGITSITTPGGVDNVFTVHSNDTTERFRVDSNGNQVIAGILTVAQDLDVDGHTNLDNVSIAGVTTFASNIVGTNATFSGNINASGSGSISGFDAITIEAATPALNFTETDANPDYRMIVIGGQFRIQDVTNSLANRFIINTDGTTTIEKNLNCSSDLDVDGHTNLDNVSISGVTTTTGDITIDGLHSGGSSRMLNIGSGNNILRIYENSSQAAQIYTQGNLVLTGATTEIRSKSGSNQLEASFHATNGVKLYHDNNEKLFVNGSGVNITGVITATSFSGDGSNLTGISAGTSLSGSTNNTVCTVTGANAIQGESTLLFDGDTLTNSGSDDEKIILSGSASPYIRFRDASNANKGYIQMHNNGNMYLVNQATSEYLRIGSGAGGLYFSVDGSENVVAHQGYLSNDIWYLESGKSYVGNFGQFQGHGTYTDFNTEVSYWGWNFVQGNTNAPNTVSSQWYRGCFSLGSGYGYGSGSNDYSLQLAIPRFNYTVSAGQLYMRTIENGSEQSWQEVGTRPYNSILPRANNTIDLGSTTNRWRYIYSQELNVTKASGNLSGTFIASNGLGTLEIGGSTGAFIDLKMPTSDDLDFRIGTSGSGGYLTVLSGQSISVQGHFNPSANNSYDLGTSSVRWRNIYTNDLNLSNEGSTNSVDNTWGDFTIQEGESDLFLINNRSGKKYKFNLTEVS